MVLLLVGLLSPWPGFSQVATSDSAYRHVILPEVAVQVHPRARLLRPPGESRGLYTSFGHKLLPTSRVAVWHGPPDSTRTYRVRAVRVRLGARTPEKASGLFEARRNFQEGRVALWLSPGTRTLAPDATRNLLAQKLLLTPDNAGEKKGWLRFDVADQRVVVPAQGLFIVAEGLTTHPQETYVRRRMLVQPLDGKTPPQDLNLQNPKLKKGDGVRVYSYAEVAPPSGPPRLAAESLFPTLAYRMVEEPGQCQSWVWRAPTGKQPARWMSVTEVQTALRQREPKATYALDFNFDLELEVEEL
ncbi:hypothetical protein FY528_16560 [Hymenobacter lutimineralis]|uniref:Uncharacterized protein n=1 Tax=Hymenobacter lutimineralis TaxID=2606448 RepID=A0A5D6UV97_9BACT|nr:hypothetical protein [Hymenobacter lutimineralis]TYZ06885.1 hypothetical protein FY528_16560 [Hymenobacter lutimineralis]